MIITPQKWSFNDLSVFHNNKNQSIHVWEYYKWITIDIKPQDVVVLDKTLFDNKSHYSCLLHNYELVEANDGTTEYMSNSPAILKKIKSSYEDDVDVFLDKNTSFSCASNHRTITLSKTDLIALNK